MKVVAYYKTRVMADEDHNFLMSRGIASVVFGDAVPAVMEENFGKEPISLSVMDEQFNRAKLLLDEKRNPELLDKIKSWTHKINREYNAKPKKKKKTKPQDDLPAE